MLILLVIVVLVRRPARLRQRRDLAAVRPHPTPPARSTPSSPKAKPTSRPETSPKRSSPSTKPSFSSPTTPPCASSSPHPHLLLLQPHHRPGTARRPQPGPRRHRRRQAIRAHQRRRARRTRLRPQLALQNPPSPATCPDYRNQAEAEALAAIQSIPPTPRQSYYAEVLIDQYKLAQAQDYIAQARSKRRASDGCAPRAGLYLRNPRRIQPRHRVVTKSHRSHSQPDLPLHPHRVLYRFLRNTTSPSSSSPKPSASTSSSASRTRSPTWPSPTPTSAAVRPWQPRAMPIAPSRSTLQPRHLRSGWRHLPPRPQLRRRHPRLALRRRRLHPRANLPGARGRPLRIPDRHQPAAAFGSTVLYYYTYGSVLAGLHRDGLDDYCDTAAKIFQQIRAMYSDKRDHHGHRHPQREYLPHQSGRNLPHRHAPAHPGGHPHAFPTETPFIIPTRPPHAVEVH